MQELNGATSLLRRDRRDAKSQKAGVSLSGGLWVERDAGSKPGTGSTLLTPLHSLSVVDSVSSASNENRTRGPVQYRMLNTEWLRSNPHRLDFQTPIFNKADCISTEKLLLAYF